MSPEDGRVRRAQEQREQRRIEIFAAALQVFAQKGYHRTSITDIVREAGVARGTFYLYFDSKSAVFHELLDGLLARVRDSVVGVNPALDTPMEEQLRGTVGRVLRTLADNRDFCAILFREAVGVDEEVDRKLQAFYAELRTYIQAALMIGQRLGYTRADLDTDVAAHCALGAIKEVVLRTLAVDADEDLDLEAVALGVLDYSLRGVVA